MERPGVDRPDSPQKTDDEYRQYSEQSGLSTESLEAIAISLGYVSDVVAPEVLGSIKKPDFVALATECKEKGEVGLTGGEKIFWLTVQAMELSKDIKEASFWLEKTLADYFVNEDGQHSYSAYLEHCKERNMLGHEKMTEILQKAEKAAERWKDEIQEKTQKVFGLSAEIREEIRVSRRGEVINPVVANDHPARIDDDSLHLDTIVYKAQNLLPDEGIDFSAIHSILYPKPEED